MTSTHNIFDLVEAVRQLPPSGPEIPVKFLSRLLEIAAPDGTITGDQVAPIVLSWPGAQDECKNSYLRNNGIVATPDIAFLKVDQLGSFVERNGGNWAWGQFLDGQHQADLFGELGSLSTRRLDPIVFSDSPSRRMVLGENVEVNMVALSAHITRWVVQTDKDGVPWAIAHTDWEWGHNDGHWCLAFALGTLG